MIAVSAYEHKIGATLDLVGQLTLNGQAQDMAGWSARSQMRGPAGEIDLECVWLDAGAGVLAVRAAPDAQGDWRPGRYGIDVRLESPSGEVLISSADQVQLVAPVTRPAQP
ncbi:hypothetical protein C662_10271 [Thauera sp. 28]|uniref:hypothetical protein n=1 Tax=Thauera sp. 28 TaxID=303682 RepID=UPI0002D11E76|nr:hypothetical protein [Thauera sp. 28]ENO92731.1 hypothetical protein C662_10271 [Thauera sp. 28]